MDILDKHDLIAILNDPDLRRKAFDASSPIIDKLEQFFRVELPERERIRAVAARHAENGRAGAAVRAATTGKKPAKAKARKRYAGLGAVFALAIAACGAPADDMIADDAPDGGSEDGGTDVDADPNAPDAAPPDAGAGLPNGAPCDPRAAECAAGFTCRVTSLDPVGGTCRAAGAGFENDSCDLDNGDDDCGLAMACLGTADPRCYVICDPGDPVPRCGATDTCVLAWGATVDLGSVLAMKSVTLILTIVLDEPTADFVRTAANMSGTGSVESAIEAMIIATRSRMRESAFVKKSVDELLDAVIPAFRAELHQRLVRDAPIPPAPEVTPIGTAERRVIAALLDRASNEFSTHGCSDFNFARYVPNLADRRAIVREGELRNSGGEDYDPDGTYENYEDWVLMRYFAEKLGRP